jgi:HSP20 family protein
MHSLFNDWDTSFGVEKASFSPRVDITESEDSINLHAELPGLSKDNVKVTINDDNVLIIKGEKEDNSKNEEKDENDKTVFLRMERSYGSFTRSFVLPENVDKDSIKGNFENGILKIELAKKEPVKPKELEITID